MDASVEAAAPQVQYSVEVERHRVRRPLGTLFWLAVLLVPVLLTGALALTRAPSVEAALRAESQAALSRAGVRGVTLLVDGRSLTAEVPTGQDPDQVRRVLSRVPGVMSVQTRDVYASAREARACQGIQRKVDRVTRNQRIPFSGSSIRLTATGRQMVREVARLLTACRAVDVTVGGHTDSSTVNGADISLLRARAIIDALKKAGVEATRMEPRGYGDQFPVAPQGTKAGRTQNQRGSIAVQEN